MFEGFGGLWFIRRSSNHRVLTRLSTEWIKQLNDKRKTDKLI